MQLIKKIIDKIASIKNDNKVKKDTQRYTANMGSNSSNKNKLSYFKNFFKFKNKKDRQQKLLILSGFFLFLFSILMILFSSDNAEAFKETVDKYVKSTAEYDVKESANQTTGLARQLVLSQEKIIENAKAKGLKTTIEKIDTKIINPKRNVVNASTKVYTIEQYPGKAPEHFVHLFVFEGQKVGSSWKISQLTEVETRKK